MTPVPPNAGTAWTGIHWRKLTAGDPLGHVQTVTRWRGGFVAVGDLAASGASAHSKVWVSADGRTWNLLGADVFGPATVVLGVEATPDGLIALTLRAGTSTGEGGDPNPLDQWFLVGPLQTWTSSSGTTWTAHPGPAIALSDEIKDPRGDYPFLRVGTPGMIMAVKTDDPSRGSASRMAVSRDGVAWDVLPIGAFPAGWTAGNIVTIPSGFLAIGDGRTKPSTLSSTDGRVWRSHEFPAGCPVDGVVTGPAGFVGVGSTGVDSAGVEKSFWCSSFDGRSWRSLPGLPPLGYMPGLIDQECQNACADGNLLGNGERMLAYRGWRKQVGWTSLDGRSWKPLKFVGQPERSKGWLDDACTMNLILTPIGVSCPDSHDSIWFGTPLT